MTLSFVEGQVAQGQTDTFNITWSPDAANDTLTLVISGVASGQSSLAIPPNIFGASGAIQIPANFPDGTIELHAYIHADHDSAEASFVVLDTIPPIINSNYAWVMPSPPLAAIPMALQGQYNWSSYGNVTFIAGITDSAQLAVNDNHGLAWAGWALSAPANLRDSVPLTGLDTIVSIPMAIPASLSGTTDSVDFFARDVDNNLTVYPVAPASVALYADHPVVQSPHPTPVPDLAFDPKHSVVLVADPANRQVEVYKIPGLALQTTITFPHAPVELDVTPGGDSALVLLDSTATVAVVNLAGGYSVTSFALPFSIDSSIPTDTVNIGWRIRIAADDRALITTRSPDAGLQALVEVNLVNDSIRIVTPAVSTGGYSSPTVRSPDGSLVVLPGMPITSYNLATRYIAATHTYTYSQVPYYPFYTYAYLPPQSFALSNSPYYFLSKNVLVDTTSVVGGVGVVTWFNGAVTANGHDVYMPASPCTNSDGPCIDSAAALVIHYRVPNLQNSINNTVGQPLDIFDAPQIANALAVSPDGNTLIAVGPTALMAFDLTQSSPPSASRRRAPIIAALRKRPLSLHALPAVRPKASPTGPTKPANLAIRITGFRHR